MVLPSDGHHVLIRHGFLSEVCINSLSDKELVEKARSGSREAFGEIYVRYGNCVYDYSLRFTRDPEAAKDATQETFLRMYSALAELRNGVLLRVWLLSIARNFLLNSRRNKRLIDRLQDEPISTDDSPFDTNLREENSLTVRSLVDSLHPALREVVVLREYEGLSYRDVAAVTGISEENVAVRLFRARKAIAARLKRET
jgi:RNA polymerase sigma-70 factor (ECF subfamily)